MSYTYADVADLQGAVLSCIERARVSGGDALHFTATDGRVWTMRHIQDCCETVFLESVSGDLGDLVGTPILVAEENTNAEGHDPTAFWTFYKFTTIKGHVTLRWCREKSYYCTDVDFYLQDSNERTT